MKIEYVTVPRLWPGETFVCVASGPSVTQDDVDACRGKARVIAVNDGYKLARWADVLYACDSKWWGWAHRNQHGQHPHFKECTGLKFGLKPYPGVQLLRHADAHGLDADPGWLRTGLTSGYQAINLAVHLGAARILLLGYDYKTDGKKDHFFGAHPDRTKPPFNAALKAFQTIVEPLKQIGVSVVNCSPGSALRVFPMARIQDVLPAPLEAAS